MVKTVTPFSSRAKEGATDSPLGDFVEVPQTITSTASAGFYDENGKLTGNNSTDRQWDQQTKEEQIPNTETMLVPGGDPGFIDMTGFKDLFIAMKPSRAGNYATSAVFGPDTNSFRGLEPIDAASVIRGASLPQNSTADLQPIFEDGAQSLTADVWNIYLLQGIVARQSVLQFKIVNNTGGTCATFEFAFLRCV